MSSIPKVEIEIKGDRFSYAAIVLAADYSLSGWREDFSEEEIYADMNAVEKMILRPEADAVIRLFPGPAVAAFFPLGETKFGSETYIYDNGDEWLICPSGFSSPPVALQDGTGWQRRDGKTPKGSVIVASVDFFALLRAHQSKIEFIPDGPRLRQSALAGRLDLSHALR